MNVYIFNLRLDFSIWMLFPTPAIAVYITVLFELHSIGVYLLFQFEQFENWKL